MPAVSIITGARSSPLERATKRHPNAYLATVSGIRCVLPIAPAEVDLDGFAGTFETLDRTGRKPIVSRTGEGLRSMSYDLWLASPILGQTVQPYIDQLVKVAQANSRVTFSYGKPERGLWRLTRCAITVTERAPYTNDPTKANVALTFLEAVDAAVAVGPLTGGSNKPLPKLDVRQRNIVHTVVRGDSPQSIALRYYGVVSAWPLLLKANGITDPRKLIAGRKIKIVPLAGTTAAPVRPGGVDLRKVSADVRRILMASGWLGTQLDGNDVVIYPPVGTTGVTRSKIVTADAAKLIAAGFTRRASDKVDTLYPPPSIRAT